MTDLHEALKTLAPIQWSDVPLDDLPRYLQTHFTAGELICNSVPPPPSGEPFHSAQPHHKRPNAAKSAVDMHVSTARSYPPHPDHEALQNLWGKPMKFSPEKNPLGVSLYKMAGHDRHGAWFARRSVHEGIGFEKFRKAMIRELPHTMTVEGGPGAGAVRGLAGDRRIEKRKVEGLGTLLVYQLSGNMPSPVSPRDFVPLLLTTESGISEKSGLEVEDGAKHVPRSYMIVSRPLEHPDAPERPGYVRGRYESVELIREIPLHKRKAVQSMPNLLDSQPSVGTHTRDRGTTISFTESRGDDAKGEKRDLQETKNADGEHDPELNPVEWIMITRSDPGGGIPRFLVEKGTPDAMLSDVKKFFNWACSLDDAQFDQIPDPDEQDDEGNAMIPGVESTSQRQDASLSASDLTNGAISSPLEPPIVPPQRAASAPIPEQTGLFAQAVHVVESSIAAYAPQSVSHQIHQYLHPGHPPPYENAANDDEDDSDSDDTSSVGSFASAAEEHRSSLMEAYDPAHLESNEDISLHSASSSVDIAKDANDGKKLNQHDKEVLKLMKEREKLDRKLAKKRAEEEKKLQAVREKETAEQDKAREKLEKELQKAEEKHRKELEKLKKKQEHEARKAEEKRKKKEEQNKLSLVSRERDEFRGQLESFKRENALLRERLEDLQRENMVLVGRLGKAAPDSLKGIQDEVEGLRKRAGSRASSGKKSVEGQKL